MEATKTQTLFERLGGMAAVNAAVGIFYEKALQDEKINHFFRHIDIEKQSGKLKAFMAYAFGAPMNYSGKSMRDAHQHMHITEEHFHVVAGHLIDTLQELNISQALIDEVVAVVLTTKNDVMNR